MSALEEPPPPRLLRRVDEIFVDNLKKRLRSDPNAPGVPALAVTCKNVEKKELFKERHKDIYRYEVNGGLHSAKARQGLANENTIFSTVQAVVYVGLSDEEALRLASRHNVNGHYNHRMTHRDYVRIFF